MSGGDPAASVIGCASNGLWASERRGGGQRLRVRGERLWAMNGGKPTPSAIGSAVRRGRQRDVAASGAGAAGSTGGAVYGQRRLDEDVMR